MKEVLMRQEYLKKLMEARGITSLFRLSEASNIPMDTINRYYFGGNSTKATIQRLADFFNIEAGKLL